MSASRFSRNQSWGLLRWLLGLLEGTALDAGRLSSGRD